MPETHPLLLKTIYEYYPDLKAHLNSLESALVDAKYDCDFKVLLKEVSTIHNSAVCKERSEQNELLATINPR